MSLALPALAWALRKASDFVQSLKCCLLCQTECEAYSVWSSASGPRSRSNSLNPGTPSRWLSRFAQMRSNSASLPLTMRKRFIAIYIFPSATFRQPDFEQHGDSTTSLWSTRFFGSFSRQARDPRPDCRGSAHGPRMAGEASTIAPSLPAALPLFATALRGLGLMGWVRKAVATTKA